MLAPVHHARATFGVRAVIIRLHARAVAFNPQLPPLVRGSVQQGLSAAGGALGFYTFGRAADKRYSLAVLTPSADKGTTMDFGLRVLAIIAIAAIGWFVLSKIDPLGGKDYSGVPPKTKVKIVVILVSVGAILLIIKSMTG